MPVKRKTTKKKTAKKKTTKKKVTKRRSNSRMKKGGNVSGVKRTTKLEEPVDQTWVEEFLDLYKKRYSVSSACRLAGVSRTTVYRMKRTNEEFAKQMEEAHEIVVDKLENSAMRRAIEGHNVPVFFQGEKCGSKRVYDNALTIFMLKKNRPGKYDDKLSGIIDPEEYAEKLNKAIAAAENTVPTEPGEE